jgi:UDP-N-acetyl-D-glucosamine dehydrogenase
LHKRGAKILFHDPYVTSINVNDARVRRSALTDRALADADCVLLLTPHNEYDPAAIAERSQLVFDAQNAVLARSHPNVVRL